MVVPIITYKKVVMSHLVQNVIHISEEKEEYGSRAIFSIPSIYHTHIHTVYNQTHKNM